MKARLVSLLPVLFAVAACSSTAGGDGWSKPGASSQELDSALYWCTKSVSSGRYTHPAERMNNMEGASVRSRYVDEDCMRDRGFQKAAE